MKTKNIIVLLIVLISAPLLLFSKGAKENSKVEKVSFSDLDLSTTSLDTLEKAWKDANEEYEGSVKALKEAMNDSFSRGDVSGYLEERNLLYALEKPRITKEMTTLLVERIEKESDENVKNRIATFLSENSSYYHPSVKFIYSYSDGSFSSSFSSSIAGKVGEKIKAPVLSENMRKLVKGWGTKDGVVLYSLDDEIPISYGETELYAIFSSGVYFNNSFGEDVYLEGDEIEVPTPTTTREGLVFVGWYDKDGNLLEGNKIKTNESAKEYNALYRGITLEALVVETYDQKVPEGRDARVRVYFQTCGNESLKKVKITLEERENLSVNGLTEFSKVSPNSFPTSSFIVNAKGSSGDIIKSNIIVEDGDGEKWVYPVEFTIR